MGQGREDYVAAGLRFNDVQDKANSHRGPGRRDRGVWRPTAQGCGQSFEGHGATVFAIGLQACALLASGYEISAAHALASLSCTEACPVITGLQDPCSDEPDWCKNNAICINDARQTTFKTCICRHGYRGDRCDEVGVNFVTDFTFYLWSNEIYIFFQSDIYSMPHVSVWQNVFDDASVNWPMACAGAEADGLPGSWKLTSSGEYTGALCSSNIQQIDLGNSITRLTATGTTTAVDPSQAFCTNQAESCGGVTTQITDTPPSSGSLWVVEYNATGQNGAAYQMLFKFEGPDGTQTWLERGLGPDSEVVTDATPRTFALPLNNAGSYTLTVSIGVYDYKGEGGSHTAVVDIIAWEIPNSNALQFCNCSSAATNSNIASSTTTGSTSTSFSSSSTTVSFTITTTTSPTTTSSTISSSTTTISATTSSSVSSSTTTSSSVSSSTTTSSSVSSSTSTSSTTTSFTTTSSSTMTTTTTSSLSETSTGTTTSISTTTSTTATRSTATITSAATSTSASATTSVSLYGSTTFTTLSLTTASIADSNTNDSSPANSTTDDNSSTGGELEYYDISQCGPTPALGVVIGVGAVALAVRPQGCLA
ncbi:hypothetical protein AK812_SmicGene21045 [Symbiodinium microadriaticum]|uniref:EGF-like domain-containing protein n=1 Tax=Symbiodinium microadriaticum TaxID=2951 RepID=A0A1Q9DNF6_SYMMI|nr:hypothetical protein AK812_SmicGene21045 [Symbiodinium microadriaticum]